MDSGKCFIDDDMNEVYRAFEKCNAIIISAPAYYRNVPAQLKAAMDRTFAAKGTLRGKFGGAISVGRGSSGGGQCIVLTVIHNYYLSRQTRKIILRQAVFHEEQSSFPQADG